MPDIQGLPVSQAVYDLNKDALGSNAVPSKPASKYHSTRTEAKGLSFQSGHEAVEISKLIVADEHKAGVFGLRLQVRFPLYNDEDYVADATYADETLQFHVVDAKGFRTPDYRRKARLFKKKYGMEITEL